MLTYSEAQAKMGRSRTGTPRLGNNTYLHTQEKAAKKAAQLNERARFFERHGLVPDKGKVVMFKAVDEELVSGYGYHYPLGATVACDDWEALPHCGNGLHFWATADQAVNWEPHGRFLACEIAVKDMVILDSGKVKVPSATVLYEVSCTGERI
jgi:hypothetical protein